MQRGFEILLVMVVVYFGMSASRSNQYYARIGDIMASDADGWLVWFLGLLVGYAPILAVVVVLLTIVSIFVTVPDEVEPPVFAYLVWAGLGWWVGRSFEKALLSRQVCNANSIFGCSLDGPLLAQLAYSVVTAYLVLALVLYVLSSFAETEQPAED